MSRQGWVETLLVSQVDGPSVNAAAATTLLPNAALLTFPNNFFDSPGKSVRLTARGRLTTNTTGSAGTLTIVPTLGGANVGFTSNAIALVAGAVTSTWEFEAIATCRAIGNNSVGSFLAVGSFTSGAATANTTICLPISAPTAIATFDTTTALQLDLKALFSVGTASEAIVCHQFIVEALN